MTKILTIDDNNDNLMALTTLLSYAFPDAEIITSLSGKDGIEKARIENPDVILLDLIMPVMDGFETCKLLKEDDLLQRIPIIILSAMDQEHGSRAMALKMGAETFLSKPIDRAELTAQVSSMLRIKQSEDKVRQENQRLEILVQERTQGLEESNRSALNLLEELKAVMEQRTLLHEALLSSEDQFHSLYNDAPVGLYRTTAEGTILMANRAIYDMLGFSDFDAHSFTNLEELGFEPSYRRAQFSEQIEKFGEVKNLEAKWICRNGEAIIVRERAKVVRDSDGKPLYYDGTVEDITERRRSEEALKEALIKAESSNLLKTAFMNNISHEVRTPLNGVLGFSNLITQPDITDDEKQQYYSLIKSSSNRLLTTITSYMDISLIASGNIEVKRKSIDLHKLLYNLIDLFQPLCANKEIELLVDIPDDIGKIILFSDEELLRKILIHLLDNAVKFTDHGKISLGYIFKSNTIQFYVKDTGIGVGVESHALIFESFTQEEKLPTRCHEGSGLGLSIAQGFVRLIGGELRLESKKGSGSNFFFTIPFDGKKMEVGLCDEVPDEGPVNDHAVILIVEDDESNKFLLNTFLYKTKATLLEASNGKEAIDLCHKHPEISLVLMDIKMPGMDGLEATGKIKLFRKNLPIIGITAFAMSGDEKKALEAGFDEYLSKPLSKEDLLDKIKHFVVL